MSISGILDGLKATMVAGGLPTGQIHTTGRTYRDVASMIAAARPPATSDAKRRVLWWVLTHGPMRETVESCQGLILRRWPVVVQQWVHSSTATQEQQSTVDYVRAVASDLIGGIATMVHNDYTLGGACSWIEYPIASTPVTIRELKDERPRRGPPIECHHCEIGFTAVERLIITP